MACLDCARGFCALCEECECCSNEQPGIPATERNPDSGNDNTSGQDDSKKTSKDSRRTRTPKSNDELKDPHSTGRKRAATLFPLESSKPCEWKNLAYCGGGKFPIIGCIAGKQQARHHGPDKNTLNNSDKNVHRICDDCHNIWHAKNDPTYDSYNAQLKHEPRPATNLELIDRAVKNIYVAAKSPELRDGEYFMNLEEDAEA